MAEVARSVCLYDCSDTCALRVTTAGGAVVAVAADPTHPTTAGFICEKARRYPERLRSADRVLHPMVRTGPKGEGRFRRASWVEAAALIARRWRDIIARHGAEAILPYSYLGSEGIINAEGFDRRFFHALGASRQAHTICSSAGGTAYRHIVGARRGVDPEHDDAWKLYVLWGRNAGSTNLHLVPRLKAARRRGCRVVLIDPVPHGNVALADWILTPRPGSDAALALGLMHVVIRDDLHDREFVERYTEGFAALADRVAAYFPARVAALTGLPAADIVEFARVCARVHPSVIQPGVGMTHTRDGDAAIRNIACLTGLTGAWRHPGGGMLFGNGDWFPVNHAALQRPDLAPPGVRTINMVQLGAALTAAEPPVMSLYVYGTNPAVVAPDQEQVLVGLARSDLFVVVHELMMTDTCRYADVVLPACSQFEYEDLAISRWHLYIQHNPRLVSPAAEAKPNTEVFRLLARALELREPSLADDDETLLRTALDHPEARRRGITLDALRERGWMRVRTAEETARPFAGGFPTASGKLEFSSRALAAQGLDPLPSCAESVADDGYPLHLVTRSSRHFINSSLANVPALQRREHGRATILVHPDDAAPRGIRTGDAVKVASRRGECRLHAVLTDAIRPGVVATMGLWWLRSMPGGRGINVLTDQAVTALAGGPTFNSTMVELERLSRRGRSAR
ncbi:MAG: molybdopterin oxidoreductase family protein [Candidatus Rokubacteria bacterium]|nr:molybdopterin oxidoreductase family protein [Candidatus Rokubacteria bacterium]